MKTSIAQETIIGITSRSSCFKIYCKLLFLLLISNRVLLSYKTKLVMRLATDKCTTKTENEVSNTTLDLPISNQVLIIKR